jgi:hypothetical protein
MHLSVFCTCNVLDLKKKDLKGINFTYNGRAAKVVFGGTELLRSPHGTLHDKQPVAFLQRVNPDTQSYTRCVAEDTRAE